MLSTATIVQRVNSLIINPVLAFLFAAALLVFFWGVAQFLLSLNVGSGGVSKEDGKRHMLWGVVGMFVMVASWALIQFVVANVCGDLSSCYAGANFQ